jgi:hypothetical protein
LHAIDIDNGDEIGVGADEDPPCHGPRQRPGNGNGTRTGWPTAGDCCPSDRQHRTPRLEIGRSGTRSRERGPRGDGIVSPADPPR